MDYSNPHWWSDQSYMQREDQWNQHQSWGNQEYYPWNPNLSLENNFYHTPLYHTPFQPQCQLPHQIHPYPNDSYSSSSYRQNPLQSPSKQPHDFQLALQRYFAMGGDELCDHEEENLSLAELQANFLAKWGMKSNDSDENEQIEEKHGEELLSGMQGVSDKEGVPYEQGQEKKIEVNLPKSLVYHHSIMDTIMGVVYIEEPIKKWYEEEDTNEEYVEEEEEIRDTKGTTLSFGENHVDTIYEPTQLVESKVVEEFFDEMSSEVSEIVEENLLEDMVVDENVEREITEVKEHKYFFSPNIPFAQPFESNSLSISFSHKFQTPSFEKPTTTKLTPLPSFLLCSFEGESNTWPILVSSIFFKERALTFVEVLKEKVSEFGWTISHMQEVDGDTSTSQMNENFEEDTLFVNVKLPLPYLTKGPMEYLKKEILPTQALIAQTPTIELNQTLSYITFVKLRTFLQIYKTKAKHIKIYLLKLIRMVYFAYYPP